ncbi:NUDIX hydrolase [Desulfonatronospira sp.]|uniref:NUDIX hydrolase n=1 Tax=Desulfonatronospira sp. TaxID=1962951 RepID=UPI0025C70B8A|nr:NUDIX hydrolase [Desulfonatronospira sp.]
MNQDMHTPGQHSRSAYPALPRVAVGAVVKLKGSFLLVQRANPPSQGQWSIPGGKIRLGESMQQAAEREVLEETGVTVRAGLPLLTFDLIHRDEAGGILFHYVIVDLWAEYIRGRIRAGTDATRAAWIAPENFADYKLSPTTLDLLTSL